MRISQVLLKMELGIRRIARTAVEARPTGSTRRRFAAGGRGERARGDVWEMATEVVAARWRIGVLEREEFQEAAEDQELARELSDEESAASSSSTEMGIIVVDTSLSSFGDLRPSAPFSKDS